MFLTNEPNRKEVLNHYETVFTSIRQFREAWKGSFSSTILGSFQDLQHNIEQELDQIEYLKSHQAADLSGDDYELFHQLDLLIDEDLEQLRNDRIEPAQVVLSNNYNDGQYWLPTLTRLTIVDC